MERVVDGQFVLARVSFDPFWWRRAWWTTCSSLPTTSTMLALCVGLLVTELVQYQSVVN